MLKKKMKWLQLKYDSTLCWGFNPGLTSEKNTRVGYHI